MNTPVDWHEAEADLHSWRRELDRLKRRARARLPFTLLSAALVTAAAVWFVTSRRAPAESRILIRVSESPLMEEENPLTTGDLASYLYDAAFTTENLAGLIEKYDLYPLARARGESVAVETMKWSIDIDVSRNYFLAKRYYNDPLRTARVAVRFQHEDPDVSFKVARELARLVIDTEASRRVRSSEDLAGLTEVAFERASAALERRQEEIADRQRALAAARRRGDDGAVAAAQVELERLSEELKSSADSVRKARESKRLADLRRAVDRRGVGLLFQIVDERPPPAPPDTRAVQIRIAMLSLACFLLILPLGAVAIGAFDQRLHDSEDVRRLGLAVIGHLPRFRGCAVGSMRARRRAEHKRRASS